MSDRLREQIAEIMRWEVNANGEYIVGHASIVGGEVGEEMRKLLALLSAEVDKARRETIQEVAKSAKPEIPPAFQTGDIVFDTVIQYLDQYEQNIKELLGGE